jgi:hypothetical protein
MGNAVTLGLAAFCAVMTGIVAVEWVNPPRLKGGSANSQSTQGAGDLEVKPVESFAIAPLSRYDEIIARPLFLASRRPAEVLDTVGQQKPGDDAVFSLLGVVMTPERMMALLQVDKSGKIARLRVGETVEGWQLESVQATSVLLRRGDVVKNLPLERNKKTTARPGARIPKVEKIQNVGGSVPPAAPAETPAR